MLAPAWTDRVLRRLARRLLVAEREAGAQAAVAWLAWDAERSAEHYRQKHANRRAEWYGDVASHLRNHEEWATTMAVSGRPAT